MHTRREFLAAAGTTVAAGATASALAEPVRGAEAVDLSGWFEKTDGADEVVDATGRSKVTVEVGASGNGGAFAFAPAAVRVDPGTTVIWTWTGKGGGHNVVSEDGAFESETRSSADATFEWTPESTGVIRYACTPHRALGMRGAVVAGDVPVSLSGGSGSGDDAATSPDGSPSDLDPARSFGGWLDGTSNYRGVLDARGESEVTVEVGAEGNGGQFAFDPPAIHVDPGTTVVWEWVGSTGPYDVVDSDLGFRSETLDSVGHTFAVEFGGDGLSAYECSEYGDEGMRGVVLVGEGPREVLSARGLGGLGAAGAVVAGVLGYGLKLHEETATKTPS
jgi:halocyanin-like protein